MNTPEPSLDHQGLEVLTPEQCWDKIATVPVGRVAFVESGDPIVLPVNHALDGHRVVFRTARGALLHEALMDRPVAFEVDEFDPQTRTGWSVVFRGVAHIPDETDHLEQLGLDVWADAVDRLDWVVVQAQEITGRRILRPS